MLSYLKIKNFQSISDLMIDFTGSHKEPKKIIFIYGENGAGKTHIINSITFLCRSFETLTGSLKLLNEIIFIYK